MAKVILKMDREIPVEVYAGICYICGYATDPDYKGLLKSTKEHIVPRWKGGDSSCLNVTLCHHICNSIKSWHDLTPRIREHARFRVKDELKERGLDYTTKPLYP